MKHRHQITVVSHEASFTGAPLLLLSLLQLMQKEYGWKYQIIVVRGGPLETAFQKVGSVVVLKPAGYSSLKGWNRLAVMVRNRLAVVQAFVRTVNSRVVFNNSVINGKIISWLRFTGKPVVTYTHELKQVIDQYMQQGLVTPTLQHSQLFFYPCAAVQQVLLHYGVPENRLHPLNYFLPEGANLQPAPPLAHTALRFCGAGTASFRKGTDLFIEVARIIHQQHPDITFTWMGGFESEALQQEYQQLVHQYQLEHVVFFTGSLPPEQMKTAYAGYDALLLTSREDPYPLVVLEAAFCSRPAVVFESAGGIAEFVDEVGVLVKELSAGAMAAALLQQPTTAWAELGANARTKALQLHADVALLKQQLGPLVSIAD